jgi:hypothetical protein
MKITIIVPDKSIGIDGIFLSEIQQDLSWIPSNVHAVQWDGEKGHVEFTDGSLNEPINDLGIYGRAIESFNNEKQRIADEKKAREEAIEAARNYWAELRSLRDQKLTKCDWTQGNDSPLSEEQKNTWKVYRQALRELPENITDPKSLVIDQNNPLWPKFD